MFHLLHSPIYHFLLSVNNHSSSGSADRTVKFWDLETFELIGSAGPEMTGVRCMIFHPDGKALFCGLDETLKVFSWEPIRCHDAVDMRWSILGDLSIYEGKLLGCSYHHSSVGVWVADISLVAPYAIGVVPRTSSRTEPLFNPGESHTFHHDKSFESNAILVDKVQDCGGEMKETIKSVYMASSGSTESASRIMDSLDTSNLNSRNSTGLTRNKCTTDTSSHNALQKCDANFPLKSSLPNSSSCREIKAIESSSGTPRRINSSYPSRRVSQHSTGLRVRSLPIPKDSQEAHKGSTVQVINSPVTPVSVPIIIPRESPELPNMTNARKELANEINVSGNISFKRSHTQRSYVGIGVETQKNADQSGTLGAAANDLVGVTNSSFHSTHLNNVNADADEKNCVSIRNVEEKFERILSPERPLISCNDKGSVTVCSSTEKGPLKYVKGVAVQHGRTRSLVESWEKFKGSSMTAISSSSNMTSGSDNMSSSMNRIAEASERDLRSDDDGCPDALLQTHDSFINVLKSRLTKLQMVRHLWAESGMKGVINAIAKLPDHSVQIDVIGMLVEKMELFTLDLFSSLLPMLAGLLDSKTGRPIDVSLEMLVKLVRTFGPVIRSTVSASAPVGVDIQAEKRRDRCQLCSNQLQKIKQVLPSLIKKGGATAKHALELNLVLDE
uniref:Katanin p80 WD40 repeat-containing subunit B1 1 n=1 Tax=Anthurium amnicola TaxID=1678845 RepID=A0A1D1YHI6_9ARAE